MSTNARLRKLRREAKKQLGAQLDGESLLSKSLQRQYPETLVVPDTAGEKMSEVIEDFAAPLLEDADSLEQVRRALAFAMVAWNYALRDEPDRAKPEPAHAALLSDPIVKQAFESLVARKQELYPDNQRAVLDYELIPTSSGYRFNVISTFG